MMRSLRFTVVPLLVLVVAGMGGLRAPAGGHEATPEGTPAARTMTVSVYFTREDKLGAAHREIPVPADKRVAAAAMAELLAGPTEEEEEAGLTTAIPEGTELRGVALDAGTKVATVDLTQGFEAGGGTLSMTARLAQVVFTLTQFPTIERVRFALEGEPVEVFGGEGIMLEEPGGRADFEDLTPLIFLESPAPGDRVTSPARLWGTANTFEATFMIRIVGEDGAILVERFATATSGSGTRGTFDVEVPFEVEEAQPGKVVVFEYSAKDGSIVNKVEVPVRLEPEE